MSLQTLIIGVAVVLASATCKTDRDCNLLGTCTPGGACTCDPGWAGATCARADLKPLDLSLGYQPANGDSSWGGRAVHYNSQWHLFVSHFTHQCPLSQWISNSVVMHAVSDSAAGPYTAVKPAFPEFHHNPSIVGPTPDGYYLLFMIGVTNASAVHDCTKAVPPTPSTGFSSSAGQITIAWSKSPAGPWQSRLALRNFDKPTQNQSDWDCYVTNPSAVLFENGTVALFFSSVPCARGLFEEALGVAVAAHWSQPFVQSRTPVWRKPGPPNPPPATAVGNVEDPFAWRDARGNYHIVAHSQGKVNVCGTAGHACSVHFWAEAALGPWYPSLEPVFDGHTKVAGHGDAAMITRQRPQIVFADDGTTPKYMFIGGSFNETDRGTIRGVERTFVFEFSLPNAGRQQGQ
jgi:hypothetical protein